MPTMDRVTVTLPSEIVREIDKREKNRSKFVAEANHHELDRRRREELQRSLRHPHVESAELADQGFEDWALRLPDEDTESLFSSGMGKKIQWVPEKGWVEGRE